VFEELVLEQFRSVMSGLKWYRPRDRAVAEGWGINSLEGLKSKEHDFKMAISKSFEIAEKDGLTDKEDNPLYYRLRSAFISSDVRGLCQEVKYAFINSVVDLKVSKEELTNQKRIADLRYPTEWFPATRAMQRTIHLHVGPTNSGKTYHALQRLEAAKTGIYAGPLRLLAHEVYTRFNAKGKPCALVTGEERRFPENLKVVMNSCTVEMVPLNSKVDVAVIDEIQMMGDEDRGWAWTQAFLGVQAKEVHLCGELRTVPLIQELCAAMGEKLEIHRYERLSPLRTSNKHLGSLKNLQKGDAVIVFSRLGIHAMKSEIEKATNRRCAVVYGSLPPETRAQQANFFNDPNNDYDFLVASDAIGMGLNLAIKRVIFESTAKSNGAGGFQILENSNIKQIGGRAGRYKTARDAVEGALADGVEEEPLSVTKSPNQNVGYVTSIEKFDLEVVQRAMNAEIEPLKQAGIFPPASVVHRFASYFPPKTPFSYIVLRLHELAAINPRFKLCRMKDQIDIADTIQAFQLTTNDRLIFMASPAPMRDPGIPEAVKEMAQCVAEQSGGELLDLQTLNLELLDVDMYEYGGQVSDYLRAVESLHKILTLYLWLSYRFAGVFRSQALAFHVKSVVEDRIDLCLKEVHWDSKKRLQKAKLRQQAFTQTPGEQRREAEESEESTKLVGEEDQDEDSSQVNGGDRVSKESRGRQTSIEPSDVVQSIEEASENPEEIHRNATSDAQALAQGILLPFDEVAHVVERGTLLGSSVPKE
jgi:ATP-dependent RNA helicase SUPV3L1/SUV3